VIHFKYTNPNFRPLQYFNETCRKGSQREQQGKMDTPAKKKRGPGRPTKPPPRGKKRVQVSMIFSAETKSRIDQEASRSGRTLSQVGEVLIEKALTIDSTLRQMGRSLSGIDRENFEMEMQRRGYTKLYDPREPRGYSWRNPEAPGERSGFIPWSEGEEPK
jgi:hypothetical protein